MTVEELSARLRAVETQQAIMATRSSDCGQSITDHEHRLRSVEQLMPALRAVLWVGTMLGISIVGLVWAMIVGQVQITFM